MANMKLKFKGAKKITYLENEFFKKIPKKDRNYKHFWRKLFGGYSLPACPICKIDLELVQIHIERLSSILPLLGGKPAVRASTELGVELEFQCPTCGSKLEGIGREIDIDMNNSSFSLDQIIISRYEMCTP